MNVKQCADSADCENGNLIEQLQQIVSLGVEMRKRQNEYFKTRTHGALVASKQAESAFDKAARALEQTQ